MIPPIHVELDEVPDCNDLAGFLTSRGLVCRPVTTGDRCEVEIEQVDHDEVTDALRSWLAQHSRPLIVTPVGDDAFVLRAPGD